jgi:hypothetical protein
MKRMIKMIKQLLNAGLGQYSVFTLAYYFDIHEKYCQLISDGATKEQACNSLGVTVRHMNRILHVITLIDSE